MTVFCLPLLSIALIRFMTTIIAKCLQNNNLTLQVCLSILCSHLPPLSSNTVICDVGEEVPMLCPGDRSDGVWVGLSPGQGGLTAEQLSPTDLRFHPQASALRGRTHPCSFSLLSASSSSWTHAHTHEHVTTFSLLTFTKKEKNTECVIWSASIVSRTQKSKID